MAYKAQIEFSAYEDDYNEGDATPREIEAWKRGELKLYAVNCHILVTEVTEKKASL